MSATTDIGSKIKKYRKEKKYTLKNLSEQTGLSIGFLSQLERGITTIAIDSLANVADVLGVEMMDFFESDLHQENDPVMRSYDLPTRLLSVEQIEYCLGKESFALRPKILQLMPCAQKEEKPEAVKAESERFLYLLEGVLSLEMGERSYVLYPGDSMQLAKGNRYAMYNRTTKPVRVLLVEMPCEEACS